MQPSRLVRPFFAIGLGLLVSACDDESGWPAPTSISGTAAIGAPVVGGTVTLKCRGGVTYTVTTGSNGNYTQNIPRADLPCAMRLSGGTANGNPNTQILHSVSQNGGTANITPLTDLITALSVDSAAGQTLAAWFANPANLTQVSSGLAAAQTTLQSALTAAGYTVPSPFNPLTTPFSPTAGDNYDDLLEAIATAIAADASVADYSALLTRFLAGNSLPAAEEEEETDPEADAGLELVSLYAGTYTVTGNTRGTVTISNDGRTIDFDTGKTFTISGNDVYNRIPNFPSEPRVQIELFPQGEAQQRIRIFVDPANTQTPLSFVYYPSALSDANAVTAAISTDTDNLACGGKTKEAFTAVAGDYSLFAKYASGGAPDTARYTSRSYYDVSVNDSNCTISVATDGEPLVYDLEGATPQITKNSAGTDISLLMANGESILFSYDNAKKSVFVGNLYESGARYWGLYGADTASCPTEANTIATPTAIGAGPYVIAYAGDRNLGIDQRTNVTASFSDNQGLFGYRASDSEDWNRGCAKNNNATGDAVIRIGKWHSGKTSPGYYENTGFDLSAYQGIHYAIAQAVSNKPASGSKSYAPPAGWNSEFTNSSITMGGNVICNGAEGACVTVNFATNTADVNMTVSGLNGDSLTFNQSGVAIGNNGLIAVNVSGNSPTGAVRLLLAGNGADYIAGSVVISLGTRQLFGSMGLKVQP